MQLQSGDRVCLFSDGIVEQTDAAGDVQFGTDRLVRSLAPRHGVSADQAVIEVVNDLSSWAGAQRFTDDVSLVVVEWSG